MGKINAKEIDIGYFLKKNDFYIPPYQRDYNWTIKTSQILIEDLFNHLKNNPRDDYFIGNIIIYEKRSSFKNEYVVVDGQQRITTFMLLITAMRMAAFASPEIDDANSKILDKELSSFVLNDQNYSDNINKIKFSSESRQKVVSQILSCKVENKNLIEDNWLNKIRYSYHETNYYKNLEKFVSFISKNFKTYYDYKDFIELLGRVILVLVDIDNEKSVYEIFEKVNSTGVDLSLADLIKNYLYILIEEVKEKQKIRNSEYSKFEKKISTIFEKEIINLKTKSDSLIVNYLVYLTKMNLINRSNEKSVYQLFKKHISEKISEEKINVWTIINELNEQISLIKYIENFGDVWSSDSYELSLFLNKENLTGSLFSVVYLVAKKSNSFTEEGKFSLTDDFKNFVKLIDKFFTRRYITNKSSNMNLVVVQLLKKIDKFENFNLDELETILTNDSDEFSGEALMPSKSKMLNSFKENNCSYLNPKSKELKHIFFKINFYLNLKENDNDSVYLKDNNYKKTFIDYIMPLKPKPNSKWSIENSNDYSKLDIDIKRRKYPEKEMFYDSKVFNWGNLTIMNKDAKKLSESEFDVKRELFYDSNFTINSLILSHEKWTILEIEERKEKLFEIIEEYF